MRLRAFLAFIASLVLAAPAFAAQYTINGDVVGQLGETITREDDNLYALARQHNLGIVELLVANPHIADLWMPGEGTPLTLPTEFLLPPVRHDIVINLPELRLYFFKDKTTVYSFPIGIGKEEWVTPTGESKIVRKRKDPTWVPPPTVRAVKPELPISVPPGPDNPLGAYAMNTGWKNIVIHGTNTPNGIGLRSSHGCIRMYAEDIETLFNLVKVGTKITIFDKPYKLGWRAGDLFLEVTPTQAQLDSIAEQLPTDKDDLPEVREAVRAIEKEKNLEIDWVAVEQAIERRNSLPVVIATIKKPVQGNLGTIQQPQPQKPEEAKGQTQGSLGVIKKPLPSKLSLPPAVVDVQGVTVYGDEALPDEDVSANETLP